MPTDGRFLYRQWLDSEMLWTNPQDERPGHVQNPWYWMPDADVDDVMIQVETVRHVQRPSQSRVQS